MACLRLFEDHPQVLAEYRRQFRHVLVDELQVCFLCVFSLHVFFPRCHTRILPLYQRRFFSLSTLLWVSLTHTHFHQMPHSHFPPLQSPTFCFEQDTSTVQYRWLRALAGDRTSPSRASIFCAADDDQSIYGWRGAERTNVLRFLREFPKTKVRERETKERETKEREKKERETSCHLCEQRPFVTRGISRETCCHLRKTLSCHTRSSSSHLSQRPEFYPPPNQRERLVTCQA